MIKSLISYRKPSLKQVLVNPDIDLKYYSYLDYTRPYLNPIKGKWRNFDKWIIAMHEGRKVAEIDYGPETGQICIMGVQEEYQKKGIMTRLLEHALTDMRQYRPKYCWAVTNTDPKSGPYRLFTRFSGEYSDPANESVSGSGLRFKIDYDIIYTPLPDIRTLPGLGRDNDNFIGNLRLG